MHHLLSDYLYPSGMESIMIKKNSKNIALMCMHAYTFTYTLQHTHVYI